MDAPSAAAPLGARAATFAIATLVAAPAWLLLGAVLKATTHHRALGGTTFALAAVIVGAVALAFGARGGAVVGRFASASEARSRSVIAASVVVVLAAFGALALVASRAPVPAPSSSGDAVDGAP